MDKIIMIGCDLHDWSMLLKIAVGLAAPAKRSWGNDRSGRLAMIVDLKRRAGAVGANRIVFAYEASGLGFTLHDELTAAGIECHVLAPTLMERSAKHTKGKADERDAERVTTCYIAGRGVHGVEKTARAIEDALEFGAFSCEYVANLLEQRQRLLPEPGALHLTHRADLLELELPEPNLTLYGTDGDPAPAPDPNPAPDSDGAKPGESHEPEQGPQDGAG